MSLAIAAVSALVAIVLSLVVHNAARASMLNNSRDVMDERVQAAQRFYENTERLQFGAKLNDPELPNQLKKEAARGVRATYLQDSGSGSPEVWASVPLRDGTVLSLHDSFDDRFTVLDDLDRALVLGSLAVVVGGTALGVLIGGQLSRRLRKAAAAARKLAEGDSEVRLREAIGGRARDETAELARAIDGMAEALQERLEAERRVTADIAHELRTPVTGLLTAAELLPPGRPTELVRDRAQAMRQLVEDVLEVARLDGYAERAELQEIDLVEFVTRRVRTIAPHAHVRAVCDAHVSTDPRRLERILGNLLANAAKHGNPPFEVTVDGRTIRVRDHGPGFPESLLKDGPSRFRTGRKDRAGKGHGLGLTIAAGQARVLGARLTFHNAQQPTGPGTRGTPAAEPVVAPAGTSAVARGGAGAVTSPRPAPATPDAPDAGVRTAAPDARGRADDGRRGEDGRLGGNGRRGEDEVRAEDGRRTENGRRGDDGRGADGRRRDGLDDRLHGGDGRGGLDGRGDDGRGGDGRRSPGGLRDGAGLRGGDGLGTSGDDRPAAQGRPAGTGGRRPAVDAAAGAARTGPAGGDLTVPGATAADGSDRPGTGAVAVLWLPESAPTNTGSFPVIDVPD